MAASSSSGAYPNQDSSLLIPGINLPGPLREAYASASPPLLLGRAWQLCRAYPRQSFQAILPAVILMVVQGFISAITNMVWVERTGVPSFEQIFAVIGLVLANVACGLLTIVAWLAGFVALSRFYFSALLFETPYTIGDCYQYVLSQWSTLVGYIFSWVAILLVFLVVDFTLLFLAAILSGLLFSAFKVVNVSPWISLGFVVAILFYGSGILILLWTTLSAQMLLLHLPLVALANADICSGKEIEQLSWLDKITAPVDASEQNREIPVGQSTSTISNSQRPNQERPKWMNFFELWKNAFAFVLSNFTKSLLYGGIWLFSLYVWLTVWDLPLLSWYGFEAAKASLKGENFEVALMPRIVLSVFEIWNAIVTACVLPLYVSGATMFWYDGNVSKAGLDLRVWLARLSQRKLSSRA